MPDGNGSPRADERRSTRRRAQGLNNELLTHLAMAVTDTQWPRPWWYRGYRRATEYEDKVDHHDGFVLTDLGELSVQIKSSRHGKRMHEAKHGFADIVLVVDGREPLADIRERLLCEAARRFFVRHNAWARAQ